MNDRDKLLQLRKIQVLVKGIFKNSEGKPYLLTNGEADFFIKIIDPKIKWLWMSAPTRYGKSEVLAMALIYLAVVKHLKIPIVAGSEDKAKRIMEYVLAHLPDHPMLYQGLINLNLTDVEKLKVSMAKNTMRWSDGGWIYITSVDSSNTKKEGEGVVGEGGDVVVLEEAGLIKRPEQFSKVVRMPEEGRGWGKLIMSGNCIENSVFENAFNDPLYVKVRVGLEQAIAEGRYTQSALDQKKSQTTTKDWKRYWLVQFPEANEFTYFKPKKYDYLPTELKYYGACDPALGESKGGSLVGLIVLGVDSKGVVYEVESIGLQLKPEETIRQIFNFTQKFERFGVEAIQFQRYFLTTMEERSRAQKRYIPFMAIQQQRKKEERIESLEPYINTGQILFKGDNLLWEHLSLYPNLEQLDVIDTLEMCWRLVGGGGFDFAVL